ncbi:unnamed protein product [Moneuplotes crassus]|uniref:Uncharacterized protein n=1 Tax=Euplotes crassus TaxID=5936 RepID=A0AAD1X340_EUPCR|nr:unnamed protein product [Moneuplotes crassus]
MAYQNKIMNEDMVKFREILISRTISNQRVSTSSEQLKRPFKIQKWKYPHKSKRGNKKVLFLQKSKTKLIHVPKEKQLWCKKEPENKILLNLDTFQHRHNSFEVTRPQTSSFFAVKNLGYTSSKNQIRVDSNSLENNRRIYSNKDYLNMRERALKIARKLRHSKRKRRKEGGKLNFKELSNTKPSIKNADISQNIETMYKNVFTSSKRVEEDQSCYQRSVNTSFQNNLKSLNTEYDQTQSFQLSSTKATAKLNLKSIIARYSSSPYSNLPQAHFQSSQTPLIPTQNPKIKPNLKNFQNEFSCYKWEIFPCFFNHEEFQNQVMLDFQQEVLTRIVREIEQGNYEESVKEIGKVKEEFGKRDFGVDKDQRKYFEASLDTLKGCLLVQQRDFEQAIPVLKEILACDLERFSHAVLPESLQELMNRSLKEIGSLLASCEEFNFLQNNKNPFLFKIFYFKVSENDQQSDIKIYQTPSKELKFSKFENLDISTLSNSQSRLPETLLNSSPCIRKPSLLLQLTKKSDEIDKVNLKRVDNYLKEFENVKKLDYRRIRCPTTKSMPRRCI